MTKCYICDREIGEKIYNEHIILNSLGGRLKSKNLICQGCSSQFDYLDSCLSKQLNPIANWLNIKRDRKTPQPVTVTREKTGEQFSMQPGGKMLPKKPSIEIDGEGENARYRFSAKNSKEMRNLLSGLKRKNPNLDIEVLLAETILSQEYLNDPVSFNLDIGGGSTYRAICKMATNFYIHSGGKRIHIAQRLNYIKSQENCNCVRLFYPDMLDKSTIDNEVIWHHITVVGNSQEQILYSVIELFSAVRFIISLSDCYSGHNFHKEYTFNLLSRQEIDYPASNPYLSISRQQVIDLLSSPFSIEELEHLQFQSQKWLKFGHKRQTLDHLMALTDSVWQSVSESENPSEFIKSSDFSRRLEKSLAPFLARFAPKLEEEEWLKED